MSGFDPSAFVQAEQLSPTVATVAKEVDEVATVFVEPKPPKSLPPEASGWDTVATVATVAGIVPDISRDLPFAAELNKMFRYRQPPYFLPSVWFRLCKSIKRFVEDGKCAEALACGWEPIELFGFVARPWEVQRSPLYMEGFVFGMRGLRAGEVSAASIEIVLRSPPNWRCYKAHHMTGRASSLLCWEALDPDRCPLE